MAKSKQQEMIMQLFVSSRKKGPQEVDLMMEKAMDQDTASLEAALFEFFTTFRVGIYGRNHLREHIFEDTDGAIDIGSFKHLKGLFEVADEEARENSDRLAEPHDQESFEITESDIMNESSLNEGATEVFEEESYADPGGLKTEPDETEHRKELTEKDSSADPTGMKMETEETKRNAMEHFKQYSSSRDVDALIDQAMGGDRIPLEQALMEFFNYYKMRVDGQKKQSLHGQNYTNRLKKMLDYQSQIRTAILEQSCGKVDIGNPVSFKKLHQVEGKDCTKIAKNRRLSSTFKSSSSYKMKLWEHFQRYSLSTANPVDVEGLIEKAKEGDQSPLENALLDFFKALCVTLDNQDKSRPKVAAYKLRLRKGIEAYSDHKVDIENSWKFSKLDKFFSRHNDHYF